ncbi:MAG TPA: homoserine kinase [Candidatus Sulfotelmatobacter sp.]|jgi:homoserine kinase|nr:homoserine kinase [Candidatus Sulfotelmatobacter sp.]
MIDVRSLQGTEIVVPGSIANLGPGLDTVAVAVRLYLRMRIASVDSHHRGSLQFHFGSSPLTGDNRIEAAFRKLVAANSDFPSMCVEVRSDIPMGSGLGSSAAATIAGFRLYEALFGKQSNERLLTAAAELEGHGDNAAAALLGGLAVCCQKADGSFDAFSLPWPESLRLVVLTPATRLSTQTSRSALPECVPLKDAISNMQRLLLLLQSLQSDDDSSLREALADRLHQPMRESLVPGLTAALKLSHPSLLGVFLSGSGPSIVALARKRCLREVERLLSDSYRSSGVPFQISMLDVHASSVSLPSAGISCS